MNLEEMLTYTAKEFLDDRTDLIEGDDDSLWSDDYLVRMFNEGQRILARRAWVIIETGIAPAGLITLATDKSVYTLHPSILRVFDAVPSTQTATLGRAADEQLRDTTQATRYPNDEFGAFEIGESAALAGNATSLSGVTLAIASDAGTQTLRVFPPPAAAQNGVQVALKIARKPITYLTLDDTNAEPEVPEDWHISLCEYAAGKALTLPNADSDQKPEGRRLLAEFDARVREARQERLRAEMSPGRWNFSSTTAVLR